MAGACSGHKLGFHPRCAQALTKIKVVASMIKKKLIEPSHPIQQGPLHGGVSHIEKIFRNFRHAFMKRYPKESAGMFQPSRKFRAQVRRNEARADANCLIVGMCFVKLQMTGDELRPGEKIVREKNHEIGFRQRRSEERRVGKECRSRWSPSH